MDADTIQALLDPNATFETRRDARWATLPDLDVRAMAQMMREHDVRLVTITVTPDGNGAYRFIYHWDVEGVLLNVATTVTGGTAHSIADIWPAADWVEREIRDYYGLAFVDRAETPTLMLREGDQPGLFSRTCTIGRDVDPAIIARDAADARNAEGDR